MIIPPINSKGKFKLAPPFDNILSDMAEYSVTGIRNLNEIMADDPLKNIYEPAGLTEDDLKEDIANNIPIVVLLSSGNEYTYIPADRILSMPTISGLKHQERMLAINVGLLPVNYDLNMLKQNIDEMIYDTIGVETKTEEVLTSAVVLLDDTKTEQLKRLRNNKIKIKKSFRTRYYETLALLRKRNSLIENLEKYIKKDRKM